MERWRGQALFVAVAAIAIAGLASGGAAAKGKLKAEIIRSKGGIPTIRADSFKDMGFGYGYAFAEDNICTMAAVLRDLQRGALEVLRPRRRVPRGLHQPRERPLLPADQGPRDHRSAARAAAPGRAEAQAPQGRQGLRRRLQPLPAQDRRRQPARPDLRRRPVGARDHRRGRLPALLPARPARVGPDRRGRDRQRRAARRGKLERGGLEGHAGRRRRARGGARRAARGHRLQRLGDRQRGDRERQRHGARQPALPVAGLGALLPVPPGDPRQGQRLRREPVRRPGDQHRPHRQPRLDAHGLDRVPLRPDGAHAGARRPHELPGRRPAGEDGDQRRHRPDPAARRLAGAGDPHALHDPLRADHHVAPGPGALRLDEHDGLRDVRRERGEPPLPQPLLRHQQGAVDERAARHPEEVRGHPVGEHDGLGLARQGALRRHRLGPERAQREGDRRLPGADRRAHLRGPRAADPRRLALGVRTGDRPRLGRARDLRPLEPAEHVPPRLRRQLQRLLLARQPGAAARGIRPDHRRRADRALAARAAGAHDDPRSGWPARTATRATSSRSTACGGSRPTTASTAPSSSARRWLRSATRTPTWSTPTARRST